MEITFLGTGTSHGIPVLTCDCVVCVSLNPKNKRTRSSLWVQQGKTSILIDTATEFRIQALEAKISKVDGVLYTHCHADHVFGFDDLRVFSTLTNTSIPIYGNEPTMEEFQEVFAYVFRETQEGGGKPQVEPIIVQEPFQIGEIQVQPIPVFHGSLPILGYRLGGLAYVTDCSYIPPASLGLLKNLEILVLGVVRHEPHSTHMHVGQALELVEKLRPKRTYFTHISHLLEHDDTNASLPANVSLAYDGLKVSL
ncbi:MAG: MBL fold metallo-hydrolase [Firmicutes bacterium]|mgnify:CR=1 FL=1|nr:MBL fold metallo-hydrolase [Bacillota bacterium]